MQKKVAPYNKKYLKTRQAEVDSIQNEINRIFENHLVPFSKSDNNSQFLEPNIEISETSSKILVSAELPGMNTNDINLHISKDGYLTLSGEKTDSHEQEDDEGYYFSERSYGFFNRTIALPSDIDEEHATATFEKGVVKINIPKIKTEKPTLKKISVKEK